MIYLFLGTKTVWFQSKNSHAYSFSSKKLPFSGEQWEYTAVIRETCFQPGWCGDQTGAVLGLGALYHCLELCAIHLSASSQAHSCLDVIESPCRPKYMLPDKAAGVATTYCTLGLSTVSYEVLSGGSGIVNTPIYDRTADISGK